MVVDADEAQARISLRHRMEFWALRIVLAGARLLPIDWVSGLGGATMRRVGPRLRQNRRALANLALAFPEKTEAERRAIAVEMWANMGRTFAETLVLDRLAREPERFDIPNREAMAADVATASAVVGCSLHMGNWEAAILPMVLFGRQPAGVYKPLDNPLINQWLLGARTTMFPGGLLGKGERDEGRAGQKTARLLIDRARSGNAVGFIADHFDRRGEPIAFMGRTARFTIAPAMIARHVGARIWLGRCLRVGPGSRFRIDMHELAVQRTTDKKADGMATTTAMFAAFEAWIRANPEQWMWWNTRWIEGPVGGAETAAATDASATDSGEAPGSPSKAAP